MPRAWAFLVVELKACGRAFRDPNLKCSDKGYGLVTNLEGDGMRCRTGGQPSVRRVAVPVAPSRAGSPLPSLPSLPDSPPNPSPTHHRPITDHSLTRLTHRVTGELG